MRALLWGLFALLVAGVVVTLVCRGETIEEVVELVSQSGERKLRDPMRPLTGGVRVLFVALDGVGSEEFQEALREGGARQVRALLGADLGGGLFEHGYSVPDALSILPSTTMAAWSSVFTGAPAGRTGVPGNEWFVREHMQFMAPAPNTVDTRTHTLQMLTDGLVGNAIRIPTLYESIDRRAYVSLAPVYRGADLFTTPEPADVTDLFVQMAKGLVGEQSVEREAYSEVDLESVDDVMDAIRNHGFPDLQVLYFPGVDLFSHVADDPLRQQVDYLRTVVDSAVGRVLAFYDSAGVLDSTYVLFVADHGHTPVIADDRHALSAEGETEPPALLERLGFRLRPLALEPDEEDYQAVLAYQGAMAYIYLADRSTCLRKGEVCRWDVPPRLEEDVMPVVRAFARVNETGDPIPQLEGTLDLVFARAPRRPGQEALPFQIFDGKGLVPISEYLKQHPRPDLLRLEERMAGLSAGPYGHRAGDVLLLARSGLERPIEERFYFSSFYRSWHGSPTAQDSRIPLVIARRNSSGDQLERIVRHAVGRSPSQLHIVSLVKELLGQRRE